VNDRALRILAVGAHPADPVERAGGTLAKHAARGDDTMTLSHTTGIVTHAFNIFPATGDDKLAARDEVAARKRDEAHEAARLLGVATSEVLDWPESPMLFELSHYVTMVEILRDFRPDVLLCPHPVEVGRHDHMDSGRFTIAAMDYSRADGFPSPLAPWTVPQLYMYYYEDFRTNQLMGAARQAAEVVVDISAVIDRKRAAMLVFGGTQTKKGEDYPARLDRFFASGDASVGYNNGFDYAERFNRWHPQRVQYLSLD
jgi:LmbE family N-acetylglucosaminyl deacetylase